MRKTVKIICFIFDETRNGGLRLRLLPDTGQ